MTAARRALGAAGEALVAEWYGRRGYEVVDRNWRCREGEIDLVVALERTLVFCEVKTRSSTAFGSPAEAVTWRKQQRLRTLASRWLGAHDVHPAVVRFDVASVLGGQVEVIEAAF